MGLQLLCRIMGGLQTGKGTQAWGWDIQSKGGGEVLGVVVSLLCRLGRHFMTLKAGIGRKRRLRGRGGGAGRNSKHTAEEMGM